MAFGGFGDQDPARGLRDLGSGANDRSGSYGFVLNAAPDPIKIREAQLASNPMYPKQDASDPKYRIAVKGTLGFIDLRWKHQQSSEFRDDVDTVYYISDLAGQYAKGMFPWQIVETTAYMGVVDNDILTLEGTGKDNTLSWSSAATIRHTGSRRIHAGRYVFWDPEPLRAEGAASMNGAAKMADMPANASPLMTQPWDPAIHKGSPTLLLNILTAPPDSQFSDPRFADYGLNMLANQWLDSVIGTSLVVLSVAFPQLFTSLQAVAVGVPPARESAAYASYAILDNILKLKDRTNEGRRDLIARLLDPIGAGATLAETNLLFKRPEALPLIQTIGGRDDYWRFATSGTVFTPPSRDYEVRFGGSFPSSGIGFGPASFGTAPRLDGGGDAATGAAVASGMDHGAAVDDARDPWQMRVNRIQLTCAEDLFFTTNRVGAFYTDRIFCIASTSADPGLDFDKMPVRVLNS
jgi:hypothetical protein